MSLYSSSAADSAIDAPDTSGTVALCSVLRCPVGPPAFGHCSCQRRVSGPWIRNQVQSDRTSERPDRVHARYPLSPSCYSWLSDLHILSPRPFRGRWERGRADHLGVNINKTIGAGRRHPTGNEPRRLLSRAGRHGARQQHLRTILHVLPQQQPGPPCGPMQHRLPSSDRGVHRLRLLPYCRRLCDRKL